MTPHGPTAEHTAGTAAVDPDTNAPDGLFWFRRLGRVLAELAAVRDVNGVVEVVVARAAEAVGASVATLSVVDNDKVNLVLLGIRGASPGADERWASNPLTDAIPACDALRSGTALVLTGSAQIRQRYPDLWMGGAADDSLMCVPLIAGGRDVGVIGLRFPGRWAPESAEREFLSMFADGCAQALERVRAVEEADRSAAKLAFLARASAELASSLDYRATLARVASLAVPTLGDWCAVDVLEDGVARTLSVAHVDPARVAMARELQEEYPPDADAARGVPNVIRTGISELYPRITDEMLLAGARDAEHLRISRELGLHSALIVPLAVRGRVLGAITLIAAESRRSYTSDDVELAEDLARRAAVAIDNAHLHSETREVALLLQRAVLPEPFLATTVWTVASQYRPAGRTEVGGDFYDPVLLKDGRVLAVVGDVMGRGVAAAADMAQMRAAIRAYAAVDPSPTVILTKLDRMFDLYAMTQLVTVVIALIDPQAERVQIGNAGHLAPLLIGPGGAVTVARAPAAGPLLGVGGAHREATSWPFPVGSTLLLYTDGLIERRDEDIDSGLNRLVAASSRLAGANVSSALEALVDEVHDVRRDDDLTALAVTRTGWGKSTDGDNW